MFEEFVGLHVFNSKSISAWFSIGLNAQLCGCRLNSILFIDVLLIGDANGEFGFILINARFGNCVAFVVIMLSMLRNLSCAKSWSLFTYFVMCEHWTHIPIAWKQRKACVCLLCSCLGAQILGMMAVFLRIHTVRVKMDTEKIPNEKKSIAIAIYLFIVMYFITNRREGWWCLTQLEIIPRGNRYLFTSSRRIKPNNYSFPFSIYLDIGRHVIKTFLSVWLHYDFTRAPKKNHANCDTGNQ